MTTTPNTLVTDEEGVLQQIADAQRAILAAQAALDEAAVRRRVAVSRAVDAGVSTMRVAELLGVARHRVYKIRGKS